MLVAVSAFVFAVAAPFQSFTDAGMVFVLRFWPVVGTPRPLIKTQLVAAALDALHQAGLTVPRPQRDLHLKREEHGADEPAKAD